VERHIAAMDAAALDELETILSCPDPDLLDWLLGLAPIPKSRDSAVLRAMRDEV
jgi:succinate dehydrogenase flavin-adding protein (antitoxin of CptAB toxin-antitoxin module)